ncbi:tetratricopeptide repeat protein [Lapillicoccus jejuensis]|uniref:Putative thioredoxin n=1 Tax=Lapillicoccus jejuensis TaxID=402171 RepID=A0A542E2Y7_9MICO|nr:tetratricopeptide repeat protein [Lapillicoccus jejuensis]TQJ09659.1 putative thioredoxin [Lapillicoccus jejuensis]
MTQQPFSTSALRGAVDLSSLGRSAAAAPGRSAGGPGAGTGAAGGGVVVQGTDAGFQDVVTASGRVPAVVVLWSARLPESQDFVDVLAGVVTGYEGRLQLVSVDVDANPGLLRAFQVQSVPATYGLVQGQPVPLFAGALAPQEVAPWLDELLRLAVQQGVTGRVAVTEAPPEGEEAQEPPLPPHLQAAYDAIEADDLDGAEAAYRQALKENPGDEEAKIGLANVGLLQRTRDADPQAARAAAADAPTDVEAQLLVADLDVLGGHVEDAFGRLVDLVRVTAGDERNRVREHLVELFAIVGAKDPRVEKARRALTNALF